MPRALVLIALLAFAAPAAAQPLGEAGAPTLTDLALRWAQGDYRAPIVCEIEGTAHRALRRVRIADGPRHVTIATDRIVFYDLEAPDETRCMDPTGGEEPNVIGQLLVTLEARARPDTAEHDFQAALRRDGGFAYGIKAGSLRIGTPGAALREVDFKGGSARLRVVARGSDAQRRLADFGARRKLTLEVEAPDGTALAFDLVQLD